LPTVERARRRVALPAIPRARTSWRTFVGLFIGLLSLVLPWLGLTLTPSLSAWHLTIALGAVPLIGHLTYGELMAFLIIWAAVSAVRSRGRPTNTTRACGWAMVATALLFVVTTRVMGAELLFRLSSDNAQTGIVERQILQYHFLPPTSYLGFTPDATTSMILSALRMGWYFAAVSGGLLAGRPVAPIRQSRKVITALAGVATILAFGFASGLLAATSEANGIAAVQAGRSAQAEHDFARALALNPQLHDDARLETNLGQAEGDQGRETALAWLAKTASPPINTAGIAQQTLDFSQALSLAPGNPVIRNSFAIALANDMIGTQSPVDPPAVTTLRDQAFLAFTYGHYAYEIGDDSATIQSMNRVVATNRNSELQSLAFTYLALSEQRLGRLGAFRRDIVKAVALDTQDVNGLGREVAAGLYTPGPP
jgi:hypothetical protein